MLEHQILKALLNYQTYSQHRNKVKFSDGMKPWAQTLDSWMQSHPVDISVADLYQLHLARHPVATAAQKSLLEATYSLIEQEEVNVDVVEELIRQKAEQELYMTWAEKFVRLGESKGSAEDFLKLKEEITKFSPEIASVEYSPLEITADQMLEAGLKQGRWSLNLPVLQDKIGGIGAGVFALLGARPNCFSSDTDILTNSGWVNILEIDKHLVYQVNAESRGSFVKPLSYIKYSDADKMVSVKDSRGRCDMLVTEDHDIAIRHSVTRTWKKVSAKEFKTDGVNRHVMAAKVGQDGAGVSPWERFLIAYQADGSGPRKGCTGRYCGHVTVRFNLKKDRKKERLRNILDAAGLDWYEKDAATKEGYSDFYVRVSPGLSKTFEWVDVSKINTTWAEQFIEELSYWDATRRKEGRIKYDTKEKINADIVQAVAVMAGYRAIIKKKHPYKPHHSYNYSMHILPHLDNIEIRKLQKDTVAYKGDVACVEVPSGMLVARRNGLPFISGNCGKSLIGISLCFSSGGWLEQGAKIVYLGNEEAIHRTKHRAICSWAGMGYKHSKMNPSEFKEKVEAFDTEFKDKAIFLHKTGMQYNEIDKLLEEHKPDILVVDQLDKLHVKGDAPAHEKMRIIYTSIREYSVKHGCAVIGVCQASEAAAGKKFFSFDALEHSKTGKAAELDLCICIGKEDLQEDNNIRYFYLAKNKLTGDESSGSFMINKELSRMEV